MTFCGAMKLNISIFCLASVCVFATPAISYQTAWDNPNANMADGSTKPGYAQLSWAPGNVLPIKTRNGMVTMVNMPAGEQIAEGLVGNTGLFQVEANPGDRTFLITPSADNNGNDTNMIITGTSGNTYIFYLRAEPSGSSEITYSQVDIIADGSSGVSTKSTSASVGSHGARSIFNKGTKTSSSTIGVDGEDYGWIKSMKIDPSEFRFDLDIFVPNPDDYVIAPERVWRDRIFTYIDFGDKVISMTQRPVVSLLVEGGESPVGFRTDGEDSRLLIVESVGDMVLRSGQRLVCIKKREKPFLIADTASVMALAEANVAQSMLSGQSLNNLTYTLDNNAIAAAGVNNTGTPVMIGNASANATPANTAGYYIPAGFATTSSTSGGSSGLSMLPTERVTAGAFLPQSNVPLITSNQNGVAVELKSDTSVIALEKYWANLLAKFSGEDGQGLLTKYKDQVFFAVDEQGVGDLGASSSTARLYRLRIGPIVDIDAAQKLCNQLINATGGDATCNVVRMQ